MNREARRAELRKHGNHNQKDHGNWARGGAKDRMLWAKTKAGGGFSESLAGHIPKVGYMMSYEISGNDPIPTRDLKPSHIAAFRRRNKDLLNAPDNYMGAWVESSTGLTYLDVSHRFPTKEEAMNFGRQNNQSEGWDLEKGEEFPVIEMSYQERMSRYIDKVSSGVTYVPLDGLTDEEAVEAIRDAARG